jgi:hypothetical protein
MAGVESLIVLTSQPGSMYKYMKCKIIKKNKLILCCLKLYVRPFQGATYTSHVLPIPDVVYALSIYTFNSVGIKI